MHRSRAFGHGVVVSKICCNAVIVLSVVLCDCCKPMNNCRDWGFSKIGLEVWLPAFQLPSLQNATHFRKAICSTYLLKASIPAIPWEVPNIHSLPQKLQVPESGSTLHQLCIMAASCPSFRCNCRKTPVSCREAEGLVTELWSPRFVTIQCLCSQLCYVNAANQWAIGEIEVLASLGWKRGCQPFSYRCS